MTNYADLLRKRAHDHRDAVDSASPLSLTEFRARQDIEAWRERYALATAHPPASSSHGGSDRVGRPRLSEFLRRRWPWQFTIGGRA